MLLVTVDRAGYLGCNQYVKVLVTDIYGPQNPGVTALVQSCRREELENYGEKVDHGNGVVDITFGAVVADSAVEGIWMNGIQNLRESETSALYTQRAGNRVIEAVRDHFSSVLPTPTDFSDGDEDDDSVEVPQTGGYQAALRGCQ